MTRQKTGKTIAGSFGTAAAKQNQETWASNGTGKEFLTAGAHDEARDDAATQAAQNFARGLSKGWS